MDKKKAVCLITIAIFLLSGSCATIMHGSTQDIAFMCNPKAWVRIFDQDEKVIYLQKTPFVATLSRGAGYFKAGMYRVQVLRQGYKTMEFYIRGGIDPLWFVCGNLFFFGGIIGILIVDPSTGAMWNLSPEYISVDMEVAGAGKNGRSISIVMKEDVPDKLMTKAVRIK